VLRKEAGINMRGGVRKGAGRKPTPANFKKNKITLRFSQYIIDWLKKHGNQSKTTESALIKDYDIKKPDR